VFTLNAAGTIWGTSDSFGFIDQPINGDVTIVARLTAIQNTNTFAKAGLMLRASTAADAAHVILDVRPTGDLEFMIRPTTGAETTFLATASKLPPAWLRLRRVGTTVSGDVSADGTTWTNVGSTTLNIPAAAAAGLVVCSVATNTLNTSTFDNVTVTGGGGPPPAPGTPTSPSPGNGATGVATTPTLTWSATGATSYDVKFGTTNPPAQVSSNQAVASYTPAALSNNTQYFWQIIARNANGTTAGSVWSFTTAAAAAGNVVVYASDLPASALHGSWTKSNDPTSPDATKLVTTDAGESWINAPLASPTHYVDVTFNANAGVPYTIWLRLQALGNSKWNDSLWVQFSDAFAGGSQVFPLNSTSGLLVNLATDGTANSLNAWGWQNGAYWFAQPTTVTFGTNGSHTLRIQLREDGVQLDQIVLSPSTYLSTAPGSVTNDNTIGPTS
jgi:regulation of enolase protein 1 (concanavalin A-like superfamily)